MIDAGDSAIHPVFLPAQRFSEELFSFLMIAVEDLPSGRAAITLKFRFVLEC